MSRAALLLAVAVTGAAQMNAVAPLTLELRIFNGRDEVTRYTRVTIHKAGERDQPVAQVTGAQGAIDVSLAEGIYDVQAIEEREGQVVNIQWANRLVVMPYPDEQGRHLEVLNFQSGFGALQIRAPSGVVPEVVLHATSASPAKAAALKGDDYVLFIVEAGTYDVEVRRTAQRSTRHTGVEVPRDRTRLWIVPSDQGQPSRQTRRPVSSRMTITTNAMTSKMWMSPPARSRKSPNAHSTSSTTMMVQSTFHLLGTITAEVCCCKANTR